MTRARDVKHQRMAELENSLGGKNESSTVLRFYLP